MRGSMRGSRIVGRRELLASSAGIALAQLATAAIPNAVAAMRGPPQSVPRGRPGEFDFLAGEWRVAHRMLRTPTGSEWLEFGGEATCWTILGGVGSVEDLRVPSRNFRGLGLRLLDVGAGVWSDFWVNAASGVLTTPGTTGGFADGVGTFTSEDADGGRPVQVRGVWDQITPRSCRWRQGTSRDGGASWADNWIMHWTRVA